MITKLCIGLAALFIGIAMLLISIAFLMAVKLLLKRLIDEHKR
jgi:hypothetical protein